MAAIKTQDIKTNAQTIAEAREAIGAGVAAIERLAAQRGAMLAESAERGTSPAVLRREAAKYLAQIVAVGEACYLDSAALQTFGLGVMRATYARIRNAARRDERKANGGK